MVPPLTPKLSSAVDLSAFPKFEDDDKNSDDEEVDAKELDQENPFKDFARVDRHEKHEEEGLSRLGSSQSLKASASIPKADDAALAALGYHPETRSPRLSEHKSHKDTSPPSKTSGFQASAFSGSSHHKEGLSSSASLRKSTIEIHKSPSHPELADLAAEHHHPHHHLHKADSHHKSDSSHKPHRISKALSPSTSSSNLKEKDKDKEKSKKRDKPHADSDSESDHDSSTEEERSRKHTSGKSSKHSSRASSRRSSRSPPHRKPSNTLSPILSPKSRASKSHDDLAALASKVEKSHKDSAKSSRRGSKRSSRRDKSEPASASHSRSPSLSRSSSDNDSTSESS